MVSLSFSKKEVILYTIFAGDAHFICVMVLIES